MCADRQSNEPAIFEGTIPVKNSALYYRKIGRGEPIIILHGGPDFNHSYFLPELDRLSDSFHLIYYDQRGRGKSSGNVQPEDISIDSEIADIEIVREYFRLESTAVMGHSWGGLLAMEYALRHPKRVSRLVLMNTAPASHDDYRLFQQERITRAADDIEMLKAMASTAEYMEGNLETDVEYYRIHFRLAIRQPEHLERIVQSLRKDFTKEGIVKAREIEDQLMSETWVSSEYNLLPSLSHLGIPTLILHGDYDFVPVECAIHIAQAIPEACFILLRETGHFSFLESLDKVRKEMIDFFYGIK